MFKIILKSGFLTMAILILSSCISNDLSSEDRLGGGLGLDMAEGGDKNEGNGQGNIETGLLTAGEIDDNLNYEKFLEYYNNTIQNNPDQVMPVAEFTEYRNLIQHIPINSGLPTSLELALVIDGTGSMGDELNYLSKEFQNIIEKVQKNYSNVSMKYSLIMYRDQGDAYVTKKYDFTKSLETFQGHLQSQQAGGGGDYPEAMDLALNKALSLQWSDDNSSRLLFLIADAPPHDNKIESTLEIIKKIGNKGIHIYPLAASGVADLAEVLMRTAAVVTRGRYLFLTDDSGIGNSHAEPKIPCYQVTKLNELISRMIAGELEGKRVEAKESEILRTVGNYSKGVCLDDDQQFSAKE